MRGTAKNENIRPVADNVLFLLFHSPLVSCSECLHRKWRNPLVYSPSECDFSVVFSSIRLNSDLKFPQSCSLFASLFCFFFLFLINVFNNNQWHCLSELSDLSLRRLASRLESSVVASRAPGTTEAYRRAFPRWKEFASAKTEICAFPANLEHVALYLQHLLNTTYSHSAVDFAIYGIQWAHHLAGLPSPTDNLIIHAVSRAAKRIIGTRVHNKKQLVSSHMIRKLVEKSNLDNLIESLNVCVLFWFIGWFLPNWGHSSS